MFDFLLLCLKNRVGRVSGNTGLPYSVCNMCYVLALFLLKWYIIIGLGLHVCVVFDSHLFLRIVTPLTLHDINGLSNGFM